MSLLLLLQSSSATSTQTIDVAPARNEPAAGSAFVAKAAVVVPPSPTGPIPESRITAEVWDSDYAALVATLPNSWARSWLDEGSSPGSGKITVQNDDAALPIDYGQVVRFSLDGIARFAIMVEHKTTHAVAQGEEADEFTELSGRGHAAVLEDAVVYPPLGAGRIPFAESRAFNYASTNFDDSGWGYAVETPPKYGEVAAGVIAENFGHPDGWPDDAAQWIWDRSSEEDGVPVGDVYLRASFTVVNANTHQLWVAADDEYEVWFDGIKVMSRLGFYFGQSEHVQLDLDAGTHYVAIRARNLSALKAGVVFTVVPVNADGTLAASIFRSSASWRVLGYPDPVPGWYVGQIIRTLIAEAQVRGFLAGFTTSFDDDTDTAGNPWALTTDVVFQVGLDLLAMLNQLSETYLDYSMQPADFTLNAWRLGERGSSTAVAYTPGVNITSLNHEGRA